MQGSCGFKKVGLKEASRFLDVPMHELIVEDSLIKTRKEGEILATLEEVATSSYRGGKKLIGEGFFNPYMIPLDSHSGQGIPHATYAFGCQMAEVEVNPGTGEVDVIRVVAAQGGGTAVNPSPVIGP